MGAPAAAVSQGSALHFAKAILDILEDHKAADPLLLKLGPHSSFADFLVIASGGSTRQVASLAKAVAEAYPQALLGIEGQQAAEWVVADFGNVVVHLFLPEKRALYNLEKLWSYPFPVTE
jgi:ribosome-associated protein